MIHVQPAEMISILKLVYLIKDTTCVLVCPLSIEGMDGSNKVTEKMCTHLNSRYASYMNFDINRENQHRI